MRNKFTVYSLQFMNKGLLKIDGIKKAVHCPLSSVYSQDGQIVIILLLMMLVILSIGLAITQRTITNVTTSTQTEQSSRAFSAAEAGIERAIQGNSSTQTTVNVSLPGNESSATVSVSGDLPVSTQALEYPPLSKEEIAQFWFANPVTLAAFYNNSTFKVYFGNENGSTDKPALEVNVITQNGGNYNSYKYYYDSNTVRADQNIFNKVNCAGGNSINTSESSNSQFYCQVDVPPTPTDRTGAPSYTGTPIMARIRFLYTNNKHKIAVNPVGGGSLPPQAKTFTSTGTAGSAQKRIKVFRELYYIPHYFDFSVFSSGDIIKR